MSTVPSLQPLQGQVCQAEPFMAGFDIDGPLSASAARQRFQNGYRFCVRYLSRGPESSADLTRDEAQTILASGLALMVVQHVSAAGWLPTQPLGQQYGESATANAQAIGLPRGMTVWLDLEGVAHGSEAVDYAQAWFNAVAAGGYVPGLYVGASCGLTAAQLSSLSFTSYWRSASEGLPQPARGFQLTQRLSGPQIDADMSLIDERGGRAMWVCLTPPSYPVLCEDSPAPAANEAVRGLQMALNAAKVTPPPVQIDVDGVFGAATTAAVQTFQRARGLPADGKVGASTWSALTMG